MRLLMYSHDTYGLGHIRRTLLIAEYLTRTFQDLSILILTGSSMIHSMRIAPNIDYIKLPCLSKVKNGCYGPKYLTRCTGKVEKLRREIIFKTIVGYKPHFVIVDKTPVGVMGELLESLIFLRLRYPQTRIILGLRDILDQPENVKKEWERDGAYDALDVLYDDIWVYGSRDIWDIVKEYEFDRGVAENVHYLGYLKREGGFTDPSAIREALGLTGEKLLLLTLGGGGDGQDLLQVFCRTLSLLSNPRSYRGLVVTGPDFPRSLIKDYLPEQVSTELPVVVDYTAEILDYMNAADLVISLAGYNTMCEIVSMRKKAIVVPRVHPRREQLIRAEKFADRKLLKMIHPADLNPESLRDGILSMFKAPDGDPESGNGIDFRGLERLKQRFIELSAAPQVTEKDPDAPQVGADPADISLNIRTDRRDV